ncbi:MAG: choice-of-anchor D domain-containing protein [Betaproteobacteria bacterium]|nr:choice-of-anchor D domain-containing protein [Betaproteobacteria bacterium]
MTKIDFGSATSVFRVFAAHLRLFDAAPSETRGGNKGVLARLTAAVGITFCGLLTTTAHATISLSYSHSIPPYPGIDFGSVNAHAVPPNQVKDVVLTITNSGDEGTQLTQFVFHPYPYSLQANNCTQWMNPGQSCTVTVRFNPAGWGNGSVSGTLSIAAYGAPYYFVLQLAGTSYVPPGTLTVQTANTAFNTQSYGRPSNTQSIVLRNTGSTSVEASSLNVSSPDYNVVNNNCTGTIAPNGTCTIDVQFIPSQTGSLPATITIPHNGTGSQVNVMGTGEGEPGLVFAGGGTPAAGGTNVSDKNTNGAGVESIQTSGSGAAPPPSPSPSPSRLVGSLGRASGATTIWIDPSARSDKTDMGNTGGEEEQVLTGGTSSCDESDDSSCGHSAPGCFDCPEQNVLPNDPMRTGDPINAGIGSKSHPQTDYAARGGYWLAFVRTYQAQAPHASALIRQKMGPGWYSNWDSRIATVTATQHRITRGDGSSIIFNKVGSVWQPESPEITDKLIPVLNGIGDQTGWKYQVADSIENYDLAGRLNSIALPTGETYTLTYNTSDVLLSVADPAGRTLAFTYDAKGRLWKLTDPAGAITTYEYNDTVSAMDPGLGRLVKVTFPDGRARLYKYGMGDRRFALTAIATLEGGVERTYVTFTYDPANGRAKANYFGNTTNEANGTGRVKVSYNANGSSVSYDSASVTRYSPASSAPGGCVAGFHDEQLDDHAEVAQRKDAKYCVNSATAYPAYATVKRTFDNIQGRILPTRIDYMHVCATCTDSFETFTYNADGRLLSHTDRNGVTSTTTYTTDGRGLVASVTQASNTMLMRTVTTTWHPTLSVPTQIVEPASGGNRVTTYTHDSAGRILTQTVSAGGVSRTSANTYDTQGRLISVDGRRTDVSDITTYTYQGTSILPHTVTNPKGQVTTYHSYDTHGNPLLVFLPDGSSETMTYDARGRLIAKYHNAIRTVLNTYGINGVLTSTTDQHGGVTTNLYDDSLRLIGKDLSNGEKIRYTLDNAGRTILTQTFDAQSVLASTSSTGYDGLGRVLWKRDANNKTTTYAYDANGNVTSVTDPNNLTTTTEYDKLNRPILVKDPNLKVVETTYTPDGKVATIKDPNSNTTTYGYNGFGDQTQIVSPDTGTATMIHNAAGQVIQKTDSRGKTTTYTYDVLGRVTMMYLNDGNNTYTYDVGANSVGRLVNVNGFGSNTTFYYDTYGRVTSKVVGIAGLGVNLTTSYTYDSVGRTATITYPSGNVLGMTYSEGRVTNMTLTPTGSSASPLISDIRYFPVGGPESWLLGPNSFNSMAYLREIDLNGRIEKYSTPTGYRQLGFDDGGRITSMKNCSGTTSPCPTGNILWTNSYGYDSVGRLTSFSGSTSNGDGQANITQTQSFTYDNNGNRLTAVLNGTTSTYAYPGGSAPTSNRLTSVTGGLTLSNTYDNAGNLISDGVRSFVYDSRGRMTSATTSGVTTSYLIDYRNLRVKKSNATETKYFVYDDLGHMLGEYDGNGNAIQELFWLGNTPIAVRGTMPCLSGGTCAETGTAYIWTDHLNTPRELTRVNGSYQHVSLWKWDSLPFGETTPNANPSSLGVMKFNHRFPGQYRDSETGLHQNWHRDYDPNAGRYVESDPKGLAGGLNLYGYCLNYPIDLTDKYGLDPFDDPYPHCGRNPSDALCRAGIRPPIANPSCRTSGTQCLDKCISTLNPWWTTPVGGAVGVAGEVAGSATVKVCTRYLGGLSAAWALGTSVGCAAACAGDPCAYDF